MSRSSFTAGELHEDPAGFCFYTSDREEYISAINALTDPDTMHKLAVKGWVATKCGDQAMSQEEPEYKIRFLEISTAEGSDKDKGEDQEAILKKAQEFASTEVDRDDEMNPVEQLPSKMGPKDKGVGKTTDGANPKGSIKDSLTAKDLVPSIGQLNRVYEVLTRKRPLTIPMIRNLHRNLGIPAESLIGT